MRRRAHTLFELLSSTPCAAHPLNCMVLMLKPSVGLMVVMSSPLILRTMVVLPALSRPLQHKPNNQQRGMRRCKSAGRPPCRDAQWTYTMSNRISFSFCLTFLMMVSRPMI